MSILFFDLGVLIVSFTLAEVFFTMVLPRRPTGIEQVMLVVNRVVQLLFVGLSRFARSYETKDAILAPAAPVALVAQLLFWAASFVIGFALILMPTVHSLSD